MAEVLNNTNHQHINEKTDKNTVKKTQQKEASETAERKYE